MKLKKRLSMVLCIIMIITSVVPNFALEDNNISNLIEDIPSYEDTLTDNSNDKDSDNSSIVEGLTKFDLATQSSSEQEEQVEPEDEENEEDQEEASVEASTDSVGVSIASPTEASEPDEYNNVSSKNTDDIQILASVSEVSDTTTEFIATESDTINELINDYVATATNSFTFENYENLDGFIPFDYTAPKIKKKLFTGRFGDSNLPIRLDNRDAKIPGSENPLLPAIRNQGSEGLCWAFSTIGMIEISLRKQGIIDAPADAAESNLSEAALGYYALKGLESVTASGSTNMDKPGLEGHDYVINKTNNVGGNQLEATLMMSAFVGATIEDENSKYENFNDIYTGNIKLDDSYAFNKNNYVIKNVQYINIDDKDTIKKAIIDNGSVGINYKSSGGESKRYALNEKSFEYFYYNNTGKDATHAVIAVGWDDNIPKEYFGTSSHPANDGGWLIRNSWGDGQFNDGYMWISYEETTLDDTVFSIEAMEASTYKYNYHFDTTSAPAYEPDYPGKKIANRFQVNSDEDQQLDAISIAIYSANSSFDIDIYTATGIANPTNGTKACPTQTVSFDTAGIYTIPLTTPVFLAKDSFYSIVLTPKNDNSFVWTDVSYNGENRNYVNDAKSLQSLIYDADDSNKWEDYQEITNDDSANFRIKGLTNPVKSIKKVTAISSPSKLTYNYGDDIDLTGLSVIVTYEDDTTETVEYNDDTKNSFNPMGSIYSSSRKITNSSCIYVSYNNHNVEFDVPVALHTGLSRVQPGYFITINNVPDFNHYISISNTGSSNKNMPTSYTTEPWDMSQTYEYNLSHNRAPLIMYKEDSDDQSIDLLNTDWDKIIFMYPLGMGDNQSMIGYDSITDIKIPDSIVKGSLNVFDKLESVEPYSFYLRNNYIMIKMHRYANAIYFYPYFSGLLDSISVNNKSNKLNYLSGEKFDPTGLTINAINVGKDYETNNNSESKTRVFEYNDRYKDEFTFNPSLDDVLTSAISEIEITFRGKSCTLPISVVDNTGDLVEVVFDYDDNGRVATVSIPRGTKIMVPGDPSKKGFIFNRWGDSSDPSYPQFDFNAPINEDARIEAVWNRKGYEIHFMPEKAIGGGVISKWAYYDTPFNLPTTYEELRELSYASHAQFNKTGYTVVSWTDFRKGGDGILSITPDDSVEDYFVYPNRRPIEYTVNFDLGVVTAATMDSITKTYDTPIENLQGPSNIPEGYEFLGWYEENIYENQWTGSNDLTTEDGETVTVYAKWKYGIVFDANGHGTNPETKEISGTGTTEVTLPNMNVKGYIFGGWYKSATEFTAANYIGTGYDPINVNAAARYYAKWTAVTYTINYNAKGGTILGATSFTKTYDETYTSELLVPIKIGYKFEGWFIDNDAFANAYNKGNDDIYEEGTTTYTIYAKWSERKIRNVVALASPSKLHYNIGDIIDLTDLKVRIIYEDNVTEDIEYNADNASLFKIYTNFLNEDNIVRDREFVTVKLEGTYVDDYYGYIEFDNPLTKGKLNFVNGYQITIDDINDAVNNLPENMVFESSSLTIGSSAPWSSTDTYKEYIKNHPIVLYYKTMGDPSYEDLKLNKNQIGTYVYGMDDETNAMIGYPGMKDIYISDGYMQSGNDKFIDGYYRGRYFRMYFNVSSSASGSQQVLFSPYFGKIENIEIKVNPEKLDYIEGVDNFDPTGLIINTVNSIKRNDGLIYQDNLKKEFKYEDYNDEITFDINLTEPLTSDNNQIAVNFRGKTCYLNLNIMTYSAETKNIVFKNGYDGTTITTKTIPSENKVTAITNPTREHYDFANWVIEGTDTVFDFNNTIVNDDYILEAKWTPKQYPVYIHGAHPTLGPGQIIFKTLSRTYGEDLILPNGDDHKAEVDSYQGLDYLHYEIKGFIDQDTGSKLLTISGTDNRTEIHLYPNWEPEVFNMIYEIGDGANWVDGYTPKATRSYLDAITLPPADKIHRDGYKFKHWRFNTDDDSTERTTIWSESAYHHVVAVWESIKYKIKYDVGGHAATPSDTIKTYGTPISLPTLTEIKDGYTLEGWYKDASYTSPYNDTDELSTEDGDIKTIYARWKAHITFNVNGHGTAPVGVDVILGQTTVLPTITDSVPGYTFDTTNSWYAEASCDNLEGRAGRDYTVTKPKILYARWITNTYTVDYNLGAEATHAGAVAPTSTITKTYGQTLAAGELQNPSIIPNGYEFLGWYKEQTCQNPWTGNDDLTTENNVTIYIFAKWKRAVVFNVLHNGTNINATQPNSIEITSATTITLPDTSATGYTFDGWYRDAGLTNFVGMNAVSGIEVSEPTTFYAKWTPISYTIRYNKNGGELTEDNITKTYGTNVTLPSATDINKTGYTFGGWYRNYTAPSTYSNPYDGTTDLATTNNQIVDIYAKWTAHTYTINYDTIITGATIANNSITKTYGTNKTLDTPTKEGFTFVGWYNNYTAPNTYTNPYDGTSDLISDNGGSVTVYAKWKARITYNVNGHGQLPAGTGNYVDVELNTTTLLPTLSNVDGFTFTNRWYDTASCTGASVGEGGNNYTVTGPKILYAEWTENQYNITYHYDDVTGVNYRTGYTKPSTRKYSQSITLPSSNDISRNDGTYDYRFDGWWTQDGTTSGNWGTKYTSIVANKTNSQIPHEFYAKWTKRIKVTFDMQGFGVQIPVQEIDEGTTATRPNDPTSQNKRFINWYQEETYDNVFNFTTSLNNNRILYAKWEDAVTITFSFDMKGHGTQIPDVYVLEGNKLTAPTSPSANGWTFKYWYEINENTPFDFNQNVVASDPRTLHAKWVANSSGGNRISPPGGSGGNNGGGGGGGGGGGVLGAAISQANRQVPTPITTKIATIKTESIPLNANGGAWTYDQVMNTWKLKALNVFGQLIDATDGFYTVTETETITQNDVPSQIVVNNTYYFNDKGDMITGWLTTADEKTYFFENANQTAMGRMVIGYKEIQGVLYYFNQDGSMLVNAITPNGHYANASGAIVQENIQ